MADDVWLRSVPSDADPDDVRLYTKPDSGGSPGAIAGTASIVFGQTGVLRGAGALAGTSAITFGQTGVLRGAGTLVSTTALTFGQTGNLKGSGRLVGTTPIVFGQTGTLRGTGQLVGTTPIVFGQTGDLTGSGAAFPTFNLSGGGRRWYIVKKKRLYLTNEELAWYLARELIDATREDIRVTYKTKPARVVSANAYEALMATVRSLENMNPQIRELSDIESDDEEAMALLL